MAENPSNDVTSFAEGQSFDQILSQAMSEVGGQSAGGNQPPTVETPTKEQSREVETKSPAEVAEEIEYEGKRIRIEKTAKDYLKESLDAKKGMRKAFAERDKERQRIKDREQDLTRYEQLTSVFKTKGIEGLHDALAGKEGAYQEMLKKREEIALRKFNATEDELRIIQQEELIERERHLREMAERTAKETLESIQKKEEEAQKTVLSTKLNEAFETVSFEGKLGDEKREEKFNKYIWEQARMNLKEYADSKKIPHHDIPMKEIRKAFSEAAADFGDVIKKQIASDLVKQTQASSDAATLAAQARSTESPAKEANTLEALADKHKNPHHFINALFGR